MRVPNARHRLLGAGARDEGRIPLTRVLQPDQMGVYVHQTGEQRRPRHPDHAGSIGHVGGGDHLRDAVTLQHDGHRFERPTANGVQEPIGDEDRAVRHTRQSIATPVPRTGEPKPVERSMARSPATGRYGTGGTHRLPLRPIVHRPHGDRRGVGGPRGPDAVGDRRARSTTGSRSGRTEGAQRCRAVWHPFRSHRSRG